VKMPGEESVPHLVKMEGLDALGIKPEEAFALSA